MSQLLSTIILVCLASTLTMAASPPPPKKKTSSVPLPATMPQVDPDKMNQLVMLLKLAKTIQGIRNSQSGGSSSGGNGDELSAILSSLGGLDGGQSSANGGVLSTLGSGFSSATSTVSNAALGLTFYVVDNFLQPLDVVGIKNHVCSNGNGGNTGGLGQLAHAITEDDLSESDRLQVQRRTMYARAISDQIKRKSEELHH